MKLEDILFSIVIVHLHTQFCHTNKGSFPTQLDHAGAAWIYLKCAQQTLPWTIPPWAFQIEILHEIQMQTDRSQKNLFSWLMKISDAAIMVEMCALSTIVFGLNSVSNMTKDYVYRPASISGFTGYRCCVHKDSCGLIHGHRFINTRFSLRLLVRSLFSSFYSRQINTPDRGLYSWMLFCGIYTINLPSVHISGVFSSS